MINSEEESKNKVKEKSPKNKKIAVFLIVVSLVLVNLFGVWYIFFRPWTIRDVAAATTGESHNIAWVRDPGVRNPGFYHDLAGKDKIVKGQVTDISTYMTTLGPLTYIELDDFEDIHLVEWDFPNCEVGDVIQRKVHFEWSRWNEDQNVYSPQLDFPAIRDAPIIERIMNSVSSVFGLILIANQNDPDSPINVSVLLPKGEEFALDLFNCSIRQGKYSWVVDHEDVASGYEGYPIIDTITSLTNNSGQKNIVHFSDANHNGLLDDSDYFHFNLTAPEASTAVLTYLFSINGGIRYYQNRVLSGFCYIIMTNRGVLRFTSCITNKEKITPYIILNRVSDHETLNGITTIINITHVIGETPFLSNSYCSIFRKTWNIQLIPLTKGEILNESRLRIEFSDDNNNGLLDQGDYFIISGLENRSEHVFSLARKISIGQQRSQARISEIQWLTGIGAFSGDLPIIDFNEPSILGSPENKTYVIGIERMYGIPGLNLSNEKPDNWFRVKIEKDGQEILPSTDLTINFEKNDGEINITFVDADNNEFINTGDYFICTGESPGQYGLILDFVERDYRDEEGFMVRFSQSISWVIS